MAQEQPHNKHRVKLRNVHDLIEVYEDLYNKQTNGEVDAKMSDGMNTTLKGSTTLLVKLPMDAYKLFVQASIKKVTIPESLKRALPISIE
jgi:hypothetical protein